MAKVAELDGDNSRREGQALGDSLELSSSVLRYTRLPHLYLKSMTEDSVLKGESRVQRQHIMCQQRCGRCSQWKKALEGKGGPS